MKRLGGLCVIGVLLISEASYGLKRIFYNAHFHSLGNEKAKADWFMVENGKISQYGKGQSHRKITAHERIDLQGQYVYPSFTDSHAHLRSIGASLFRVDLRGSKSAADAAARVRKFISKNKINKQDPIVGHSWDQSDWKGQQFPQRDVLDRISATQPIILYRVDGHAAWVNTFALKKSGIWATKVAPQGGKILMKGDKPSGVLIDTAMNPLKKLSKAPSISQREKHIEFAVHQAYRLGVTGVHDAGVTLEDIQAIRNLIDSGRTIFRFYEMISERDSKTLEHYLRRGPEIGTHKNQLTVRTIKMFLDGAMGSRGAALEKPYSDSPTERGLLRMDRKTLIDKIKAYDAKGFQVAIHAIGTQANRVALEAIRAALGNKTHNRPRIEHAQALRPQDVARFSKWGIVASMQPTHCTSDMKWVEKRLGKERAKFTYAWRSLLEKNAILAFGSDAPVEALNPWHGLFAAMTRQNFALEPKGGFYPKQRLTFAEAIHAFTYGAAYASLTEKSFGSLEKGRWADFIVMRKDPASLPPRALVDFQIEDTYINGRRVYSRKLHLSE